MSDGDTVASSRKYPEQRAAAQRIADATRGKLPEHLKRKTEVRCGVLEPGRQIKVGVFDRAAPTDDPLASIRAYWSDAANDVDELAGMLATDATKAWERRKAGG